MRQKGVCYDVGRALMDQVWRPIFDLNVARRELAIIQRDLHCNAIRICGQDIERLTSAAEIALQLGLEVWLSPELFDHSAPETLDYIASAAEAAEKLRQQWPDRLTLSVGSEFTLFMRGIVDNGTFVERVSSPFSLFLLLLRLRLLQTHNKSLNAFLVQANRTVRSVFHGPVTYASAPIEDVDWSLFDVVCVDYYRGKQNRASYGERLQRYFTFGKPVVISEVGCCAYRGAEDKGGRAFLIVDTKHPDRLKSGYIRDEALQAREVVEMLSILDQSGVDGAFIHTFVSPNLPYSCDPLYDFDKASYSLVKSYSGEARGVTYPDMPWEPKVAFNAVATYYGSLE